MKGEVNFICGIYGSTKVSKFEILDHANRSRGNFASGIFYHDGANYDYHKTEDSFDWDKIDLPEGFIYLGHNQAPTSSERKWQEHNSHPFVCNNWIVAHNGVLTNFNELKQTYAPEHSNVVDSSIIPVLLSIFEDKVKNTTQVSKEVEVISQVLPLLKGTFGLWIANIASLNIYIARQGSTLFFDKNSFTSCKGTDYKEVKEGTIFKFNKKGFKEVGEFKASSPFLEL